MIQNKNMSSQYGQQSTSPVMTIDSNDLLLSESLIDVNLFKANVA
jgi:hypothetical protein